MRLLAAIALATFATMAYGASQEDSQDGTGNLGVVGEIAPGPPHLVRICAVAPDILAICISAQADDHPAIVAYAPQAGDVVEEVHGNPVWTWDEQASKFIQAAEKSVSRPVHQQRIFLGMLSPDGRCLLPPDRLLGEPLDVEAADSTSSYHISSTDDKAYSNGVVPMTVNRKSKPTDNPVGAVQPLEHHIYLRLPSAMTEGSAYTIALAELKLDVKSVVYRHDTTIACSEAVHAIQSGYRPDDPCKFASLSIWLGNGGGYQYSGIDRFEILDERNHVVFTGRATLTKDRDATEQLGSRRNYAHTAVMRLDFSGFDRPGRYRARVRGVGCSEAFDIADDIWRRLFVTAMRGFVNQRDGIALQRPWADLQRKRPFHPDDGVRFFQLTIPVNAGQEGPRGDNLIALQQQGQLSEVHGVWGGYMDAGDWDSCSQHLMATELLLELDEMFPAFAVSTRLSLPPAESSGPIPGILHEALWNLSCYRRLQLPDGGVRGGYGEGWGARAANTSVMGRAVGVYAPDAQSSLLYAGCAAKAARLLAPLDAGMAHDYRESAIKAWTWGLAHDAGHDGNRWRAFASIELYALTDEPAYRDAFLAVSELQAPGTYVEQPEASFTYARLPDAQADPHLRANAVALFSAAADRAIAFADHNAFGVITDRTDLPMISWVGYFSTPGMTSQNLPRAHFLTKNPRHLAAVVQACNYSLGANPDNRTYTVGVGHSWPRHILNLDSMRTGQPPPLGITIYGSGDESANGKGDEWILRYFTYGMTPEWRAWPAQESDIGASAVAKINEYTIHQQIGPVAYYWGYLAARP